MFQAPKLTNAGQALYYQSLGGQGITFTQIKLGKGRLTQAIANMTDLVDTVLAIDASLSSGGEKTYIDVSGSFSNAGLTEGFDWREIGLFAADPENPDDREADILYCYQNAYDTADFIPAASVETVEKHITIPIIVGDADNVSCLLDHSLIFATKLDIDEHNADSTAHPSLRRDLDELDDALAKHITASDALFEAQEAAIGKAEETIDQHTKDASAHVSAAEKQAWDGKVGSEELEKAISDHNEDTKAHPDIRDELGRVRKTADDALKAVQDFAYVINSIPSQSGTLTYNGQPQTPSWNGYNTDALKIGGRTSATDAGTYEATFTPVGQYHWEDGSTDPVTVQWSIARQTITTTPAQNNTLTYTGGTLTPSWSNYDQTKLTIGGQVNGSAAGTYNATFTPKDNYCWSGGVTTAKTVQWKIGKAAGSLSISPTALTLGSSAKTGTITVNRAGDGTITAESSDTKVATVSVNSAAGTVTVSSVGTANGTAKITIKVAEGTNHLAPSNTATCNVTASFPKTYGVRWSGGSETTMSRTDDAEGFTNPVPYMKNGPAPSSPFDTLQPWAGMQRTTDATLGELVSIPKYWYKWTKSGATMTLQISDKEQAGFSVSPAHANRGDGSGERSVVYVGRYHCGATAYKSVSGQKPKVSITRATARSAIAALDAKAWQYDFAMYWTIMMLYIVEFADWNVQKTIGYGCGNGSAVQACGASDDMGYHTGTMQTSRSTYGVGCQYRWIEGLWDNAYDWVDGIYFSGANIYCIKDPSKFSDTANGTQTGTRPTSSNYIKAWGIPTVSGFDWALYPSEVGGSDSTYVPDYCYYYSSGVVLLAGGDYYQNQYYGLFYLNGNITASNSNASIGCRLQKLP